MNFGTRTSAQVFNFGTLLFHGAEVNIWCRSPQLGAEVTAVPKLLVPNIDCPSELSAKAVDPDSESGLPIWLDNRRYGSDSPMVYHSDPHYSSSIKQ